MDKWKFNKEYLEKLIKKGKILLKSNKISEKNKKHILEDINRFSNFLNEDFDNHESYVETKQERINFELIKLKVLSRLKAIHSILGNNLIEWIINLDEEKVFGYSYLSKRSIISINKQKELTLQNYKKNSLYLYEYANKMLNDKNSHIQLVNNLENSSYCYFSTITKSPFLVIDPFEFPFVLNHELEHGIEYSLNIFMHPFYDELGSVYFESLYLDLLYKEQGFLYPYEAFQRINDVNETLSKISKLLLIIKVLEKNNFNISDKEFISIFINFNLCSKENLLNFLTEEIINYGIYTDLCYLFSTLKSIELCIKDKHYDKFDILKKYIKTNKFIFVPNKKLYNTYYDYINKLDRKIK